MVADYSRRLIARAGAKVTAIDLAPGMIEVARLHAMEQKLEIDYRVVAAEAVAAAESRVVSMSSPAWKCWSTFQSRKKWSRHWRVWCGPAARCSFRL